MSLRNALIGAVVAVGLTACGGGSAAPPANGTIKVATSTNVWGSVVAAVGGDDVEVKSIINDPSADPHSYESKPSDVAAVKDATLVVFNGGGYDDFFGKLLGPETGSARKVEAFAVSGKASDHGRETATEQHDHAVNEHVWYDLPTVHKVADSIAGELSAIAPDKKATFEANARDFGAQVDALLERVRKIQHGKKAVVTEPVPHYLLEAAGVRDATPEEFTEAVEGETDIPAAAFARTRELVANRQVTVLVNNSQTGNELTKQLVETARTAGVPVVDVTETLPEGVTGYLPWMTKQVDALSSALGA